MFVINKGRFTGQFFMCVGFLKGRKGNWRVVEVLSLGGKCVVG